MEPWATKGCFSAKKRNISHRERAGSSVCVLKGRWGSHAMCLDGACFLTCVLDCVFRRQKWQRQTGNIKLGFPSPQRHYLDRFWCCVNICKRLRKYEGGGYLANQAIWLPNRPLVNWKNELGYWWDLANGRGWSKSPSSSIYRENSKPARFPYLLGYCLCNCLMM